MQQLETPKMHNTVPICDETYKKSEQTQAHPQTPPGVFIDLDIL